MGNREFVWLQELWTGTSIVTHIRKTEHDPNTLTRTTAGNSMHLALRIPFMIGCSRQAWTQCVCFRSID